MNTVVPHIVLITPGFPKDEYDSVTIPALQDYLITFKKKYPEFKLTVIATQYPFAKQNYLWHGISVMALNGGNSKFLKLRTWNSAFKTLKVVHQKTPITTVHSFWAGECLFIAHRFANKNKVKHINTLMGQDIGSNNKYIKHSANSYTKRITLSLNQQQLLAKNHQLNAEIIPWSLDHSLFPELEDNIVDILGVGSFIEVKNYTQFINIIAAIRNNNPLIKVKLIGGGYQKEKLQNIITSHHLEKTITLMEQVSRDEILKEMSRSHIFLHTSNYESFGHVFAEALYSGMHVVSFNVGTARPSSKWSVCYSMEEMMQTCNDILKTAPEQKCRYILHPEDKTADSYYNLYIE